MGNEMGNNDSAFGDESMRRAARMNGVSCQPAARSPIFQLDENSIDRSIVRPSVNSSLAVGRAARQLDDDGRASCSANNARDGWIKGVALPPCGLGMKKFKKTTNRIYLSIADHRDRP
eukprot:Selendium_serpulae@DN5145_c0_g1_i1.p1